jgi:glyoxylase-like metal-dependent hydrolase (beta-lactamase superfamily II)
MKSTVSPEHTQCQLGSSLEAVGIARENIDTVVLTHGHPDHLGGLVDPATEAPLYPNAEVVIAETELEFWTGDAAAPFLNHPLLAWIPKVLEALDEHLRVIGAGDEVVSGIRSIPSHGHTPGHISLVMEVGSRELLLTGDAIVNTHASFERPDWYNWF